MRWCFVVASYKRSWSLRWKGFSKWARNTSHRNGPGTRPTCHVRREGGREWDGVLLYLHIIDHDGIGGGVFLNRPGTRPTEEGPETRSTCHVRREGGRT